MTRPLFALILSLSLVVCALALSPASAHADGATPALDDFQCLAGTMHAEAASQSPDAKALIGYYVIERALAARLSICDWLATSHAIAAYDVALALPDSWTHAVYFGDVRQFARGRETAQIADEVAAWIWPGYRHVAHFDACDTRAAWAALYTRVRLAESDTVCFWE